MHESPIQQATITSLTHDGRGVARLDDKVVFIEGVLPGEIVQFKLQRKRRRYNEAIVVDIVQPSPDRVTPPCEYFTLCGGCALQHLHPAAQILAKEQILRDHFQKFGKLTPQQWLPPLSGVSQHYRRKARLGVRYVTKKGGVLVGYRERASSYIADMRSCLTLDQRFSAMLLPLRELVMQLSCRDQLPQIEVAAGDDDIALVFRHLQPLSDADRQLLIAFGQQHHAHVYSQAKGPDSIVSLWPQSAGLLSYRLPEFDVELFFQTTDFVQVNAEMNRLMVSQAISLLELQPADTVLDLFCGLGNFTLPLARSAARVIGVEANDSLLQLARYNASHNGIDHAEFRQADLYDEKLPCSWKDYTFNKLLIDPPRDGALHAIRQLTARGPERIVYVSCNPVTLARDSEHLVNVLGYRLEQAGVMDMFPHTHHVESIAVFVR